MDTVTTMQVSVQASVQVAVRDLVKLHRKLEQAEEDAERAEEILGDVRAAVKEGEGQLLSAAGGEDGDAVGQGALFLSYDENGEPWAVEFLGTRITVGRMIPLSPDSPEAENGRKRPTEAELTRDGDLQRDEATEDEKRPRAAGGRESMLRHHGLSEGGGEED